MLERSTSVVQAGTATALAEAAWRVLALSKLRNFAAAAEELAGLGDLDGAAYVVETPHGVLRDTTFLFLVRSQIC